MAEITIEEIKTKITNNLNRSVSEINAEHLANWAIRQLAMKYPHPSNLQVEKFTTTSGTAIYQLTNNWMRVDNVWWDYNNSMYPLKEDIDVDRIALYTSNIDASPDVIIDQSGAPERYALFHVDPTLHGTNDAHLQWNIGLFPKPDASTYSIRVQGYRYPPYLPLTKYSTGTVTITGTSASVVGTGTDWDSNDNVFVGLWMWIGSDTSGTRISSIGSDTAITLASTHAAASGASYTIRQQQNWYTVEMPELVVASATAKGFKVLGEPNKSMEWEANTKDLLSDFKRVTILSSRRQGLQLIPLKGSRQRIIST